MRAVLSIGSNMDDRVELLRTVFTEFREDIVAALRERGMWVTAIRPPTVPPGTARLRLTLTAAHEARDIQTLLEALHDAGE